MKHIFFTLILVVLTATGGFSQASEGGELGVLFTFQGFSNLGVGDVNGGAGLRYYITNNTSLRGTLGFTSGDEKQTDVAVSGAVLFDLTSTDHTSLYLAPGFTYVRAGDNADVHSFDVSLGAEYLAWQNLSFGAEYGVTISGSEGNTSVSFGHTNGSIILTVWFN